MFDRNKSKITQHKQRKRRAENMHSEDADFLLEALALPARELVEVGQTHGELGQELSGIEELLLLRQIHAHLLQGLCLAAGELSPGKRLRALEYVTMVGVSGEEVRGCGGKEVRARTRVYLSRRCERLVKGIVPWMWVGVPGMGGWSIW